MAVPVDSKSSSATTALDPLDGPYRVLGNQRLRVAGSSLERGQVAAVADISERDTDIAQESAALDTFDGRPAKKRAELHIVEREIIAQRHPSRGRGGETGFTRNGGEAVPGTRLEAIVTSINSIANERSQLERDRAFKLDRQVRDAATRIEFVRLGDRTRGTRRDASNAGAATRRLLRIGRQLQSR